MAFLLCGRPSEAEERPLEFGKRAHSLLAHLLDPHPQKTENNDDHDIDPAKKIKIKIGFVCRYTKEVSGCKWKVLTEMRWEIIGPVKLVVCCYLRNFFFKFLFSSHQPTAPDNIGAEYLWMAAALFFLFLRCVNFDNLSIKNILMLLLRRRDEAITFRCCPMGSSSEVYHMSGSKCRRRPLRIKHQID